MTYQVLARKWRPRGFDALVGQEHVVKAMRSALEHNRLHHAYLFTGTRGVGKTTIARILAKCLNCDEGMSATPCGQCSSCRDIDAGRYMDLIEVDAASRTRVEDTRELLENVPYAPARGRYKVYLIDEVHMFSRHSFNALLKTLEEPPPHVKFILATTDPQKLPVTILSRCLQFNLKRLPASAISDYLGHILQQEKVSAEPAALSLLARAAEGSMRDALSLLDQAIAHGDGVVALASVEHMLGNVSESRLLGLLEQVAAGDAQTAIEQLRALDDYAPDYENLLSSLVQLLHSAALLQTVPDLAQTDVADHARLQALAERFSPQDVQLCYDIALRGRRDLPWVPDMRQGLEMILLRMICFVPEGVPPPPKPEPAPPARRAGAEQASQRRPAEPAPPPTVAECAVPPPVVKDVPDGVPGNHEQWLHWLEQAEFHGIDRELLCNMQWRQFQQGQLQMWLKAELQALCTQERMQGLAQQLQRYWGVPVRLQVEPAEVEDTLAQRQAQAQAERLRAARETIESRPLVMALRERFGAVVDAKSIRTGVVKPER